MFSKKNGDRFQMTKTTSNQNQAAAYLPFEYVAPSWLTSPQADALQKQAYLHALKILKERGLLNERSDDDMATKKELIQTVYPYNDYSRGAKALAKELGIPVTKRGRFLDLAESLTAGTKITVLNWGNGSRVKFHPDVKVQWINNPEAVNVAGNKVKFFEKVKESVRIPEFTTDGAQALAWVEEGKEVMGRSTRGSCGTDIVFYNEDVGRWTDSEFWSVYKKKKDEYRVHVIFDEVVLVQKKAVRKTDPVTGQPIDTSNVNFQIRNLSNGFVFVRNDVTPPKDVLTQAAKAIQTVGLDFGAVDVIYNATEDKAYVLEVNTAPGLEGSTPADYAAVLRPRLEGLPF